MLQSHLLHDTVQLAASDQVLVLNSAADPFVPLAIQHLTTGMITLAEDNIATVQHVMERLSPAQRVHVEHVAFHDYTLRHAADTMDIAVLNLLYQPSNAWMLYGIGLARYALRPGGQLYVTGAKERGILTMAKRIQDYFTAVETLTISKGHRVLRARKRASSIQNDEQPGAENVMAQNPPLSLFATSKLDEGTRLLLEALEVHAADHALDLGCGAGFVGLHIARLADKGQVTMVDASLAAVATSRQAVEQSGLTNVRVLASDGAQAVLGQRFDLVATNPPFHQGGIQTTEIAERFIQGAATVLQPGGNFYLVANRFLKYEPTLQRCFKEAVEVAGNTRYKVLRASGPLI